MKRSGDRDGRIGANSLTAIGFLLVFVLGASIHATQISVPTDEGRIRPTTIMRHVLAAERLERGDVYIANAMLYRLLNAAHAAGVPRELTVIALMGLCTAAIWCATYRYARRRIGDAYSPVHLGSIAALTLLVNSLWIPAISRGVYLGQWGPNVYHNPSHTLVLAFAVPLFVAIGHLVSRPGGRREPWIGFAIALGLTLSIYAKPTFILALAPATVLYVLLTMGLSRRSVMLLIALLALPTAYVLLVRQFAFNLEESRLVGRSNAIAPFEVWNRWSRNVPASIAMTFAFPVALAGSAWREHAFGRHFGYAWMLCLVATAMAALLVEVRPTGEHEYAANWFSGYLLANHLLFMVTIVEFFRWRSDMGTEGRRRVRYRLCAGLLAYHGISGMVYIARLTYMHGVSA